MAEFDNRGFSQVRSTAARTAAHEIDEGLRSYMLRVYNYMALGVAFTAIVTMAIASSPAAIALIAGTPLIWVLFAGILGLGFFAPRLIFTGSPAVAHIAYWGYAALWGAIMAPMIAMVFATNGGGMVVQALLITSVMFGATSLYGYVTKKDLSPFATFFMMAAIGLLIAIVVNALFIQDSFFSLIVSGAVVLLFAAITAYETQMIKEMYVSADGEAVQQKKAIFGAFMLYGSFVTMFIHILNILSILQGD